MKSQFSPFIAGGRNTGAAVNVPIQYMFQSSPLIAGGRNAGARFIDREDQMKQAVVDAVLAHPPTQNVRNDSAYAFIIECFNPRPSSLGGATRPATGPTAPP